jgi:hypothetical protein
MFALDSAAKNRRSEALWPSVSSGALGCWITSLDYSLASHRLRYLLDSLFAGLLEQSKVMNHATLDKFVAAHDRYLELDRIRVECQTPAQREFIHIAILEAYLEVHHHARQITALQYVDGSDFAEAN